MMKNYFKIVAKLGDVKKCLSQTMGFGARTFSSHCDEIDVSEEKLSQAMKKTVSRHCRKKHVLHILDPEIAKVFASMIIANRTAKSADMIEISPGQGYLTRELLDRGIPSLHVFGTLGLYQQQLEELKKHYNDRIRISWKSFSNCFGMGFFSPIFEAKQSADVYEYLKPRAWNEEPVVEIIGLFLDKFYTKQIINELVFRNTVCQNGRIVIYAAMPPSLWTRLTTKSEHYSIYTGDSVLFQVLLKCEIIGSLPRSGFLPMYRTRKPRWSHVRNISQNDHRILNVVKLEARHDIFGDDFTEKDVVPFYYFVRHHLRSRKNKIIPSLEKWIPGCGKDLILQGCDIFMEFGEISPQEIFKLFKIFKSSPTYKKSSFVSYVDDFLLKFDEQITFLSATNDNDLLKSASDQHNTKSGNKSAI